PFPDFAHVTIQRLKPQGGSEEIRVNLDEILRSGDCSRDVPLQWGDVVEVPELDHRINEQWQGLSDQARRALKKCLERKVTMVVKGQTNTVTLRPVFYMPLNGIPDNSDDRTSEGIVHYDFRLRAVVYNSNLLLSSSDIT